MAVINLDSQTIESIGSEISALDTTLLQSYFPELESELSSIASNVQGDELHSIINTINSQFSGVKSSLSTELPKLETFLNEQMKSYGQSEEELDAELTSILAKMAEICHGDARPDANGLEDIKDKETSSMDDINKRLEALEKQNAELAAQNAELSKSFLEKANDEFLREAGADNAEFGERFMNDWSNVDEAYQDGLISGVANTLGATLTTAGNTVGWAWNQVVNCAEWGLGALGLGKGTVGDFAAWLIS